LLPQENIFIDESKREIEIERKKRRSFVAGKGGEERAKIGGRGEDQAQPSRDLREIVIPPLLPQETLSATWTGGIDVCLD
jgi:hypothetical protein